MKWVDKLNTLESNDFELESSTNWTSSWVMWEYVNPHTWFWTYCLEEREVDCFGGYQVKDTCRTTLLKLKLIKEDCLSWKDYRTDLSKLH